jgi:hypothetical protein
MVWTILAFLCVLATKFLTAVRLRGLKAKMEAVQPHIDDLRLKLAEAEEEVGALKLRLGERSELHSAIKDVVNQLELSLKQPAADIEAMERVNLMETVENEAALT